MIKKFLFLMIFSICVFAQDSALFNIVKNVSIPDVQTAIKDAKALKANYSDENFTKFIKDDTNIVEQLKKIGVK
jgi:hypothetical protein